MIEVTVGELVFRVRQWLPGMRVPTSDYLAIDTETTMIVEGEIPDLVMIQVCSYRDKEAYWVWWEHADQFMKELHAANPDTFWIFHNAPFDLRVLGGVRTTPAWFEAAKADRIIDTGIRYILHRLQSGLMLNKWNLAAAAKAMLSIDLSKDADVRTTFTRDMEITPEHIIYGIKDAIVTAQLKEVMPLRMPTEPIHVKGYIALSEIGFDGFETDLVEMARVREGFQEELNAVLGDLALFGWYPKTKGNSGVVQHVLSVTEEQEGLVLPRSEKAKTIGVGTESVDIFFSHNERDHPFLKAYNEAKHCEKLIGTYLKESLVGPDGRIHPNFSPLVKTGRTSCARPNIQNIPRKGGIRGMYVAPPGKVLFACDYVQAELCSLAETCYLTQGRSVMRDVINSGKDLHQWFGDIIMKESGGHANDGTDYRQMAKPCNFGFPGGLGLAKFQKFAKGYGVSFTRDQCALLKDLWLKAFPEMAIHLKPEEDTNNSILQQIVDADGQVIETKRDNKYIAKTVNGRIRSNASFCSACNYPFQGLVADGAKLALWYLYRRSFKTVNFIHDEVIVELPLDDDLQNNVKEISALMIAGMKNVIKHVEIRTEGALMRRWYKEAKPIYDDDKNLLIWEPGI